ncbi:hypothetical protein STENM327S_03179 [Streptomyces tendae]
MLCTWARDLGFTGTGADPTAPAQPWPGGWMLIGEPFWQQARRGNDAGRPEQLGPLRRGPVAQHAPPARPEPGDELAPEVREELTTEPAHYARHGREYPGWGVFALMKRTQTRLAYWERALSNRLQSAKSTGGEDPHRGGGGREHTGRCGTGMEGPAAHPRAAGAGVRRGRAVGGRRARRDLRDGREHVGLPGRHRSGSAQVGCLAGARRISRGAGCAGPGSQPQKPGAAAPLPLRLADVREPRLGCGGDRRDGRAVGPAGRAAGADDGCAGPGHGLRGRVRPVSGR